MFEATRTLALVARTVAIYTRISKDDAGAQASTARQERLSRAWVAEQGWTLAEVFEDVDRSAFDDRVERPAYERLLNEVITRRIDTVVVWRLDRLARSPSEFERFWSACRTNAVDIVSVTEPVDTTEPVGVAIVRMLVTFAGLESDVRSIRIRARNREAAERGVPPGGRRPYGYTADRSSIIESEAAMVREGATRVLDGESTLSIARDWNARELRTTRGNLWSQTAVRDVLRSPAVAGDRVYRGAVVVEDAYPAILDRLTAVEVRNRLAGLPGAAQRRGDKTRLLRGRLRCGTCGTVMTSRGAAQIYVCQAARCSTSISREGLDGYVTEAVLSRLESRVSSNQRLLWRRATTEQAVAALEKQSDRLVELNRRYFVTGDLTYAEWVRTRDDLLQVTDQVLARSSLRRRPRGFPPSVPLHRARAVWDQLGDETRRRVLEAELHLVVVNRVNGPTRYFDPRRVALQWSLPDPPAWEPPSGPPWTPVRQWITDHRGRRVPNPALGTAEELRAAERPLTCAEAIIASGLTEGILNRHRRRIEVHFDSCGQITVDELDRLLELRATRLVATNGRTEAVDGRMSYSQARGYLGLGGRVWSAMVAEGVLPTREDRQPYRFTRGELDGVIEQCRVQPRRI